MKNYYICDKALWDKFPKEHFRYSHWIPTDDAAKILIVAEFPNDAAWDFWESIAGVEKLPHLVLGKGPIAAQHAQILTKAVGAVPGDNTMDVAKKAAALHPGFNPERF
jgi:hypothetical protein